MSRNLLVIAIALLLATHFLYYPKWAKQDTEATISWDVSGYYFYLPAIFIYHDLKKLSFKDEIFHKYKPTPELQQAFLHEASGNYVMKYSIGQAIMLSPGFFAGHSWAALSSKYEADGFSFPYQFMISIWVIILSIIGLYMLRLLLLNYFGELEVGLTLVGIVMGSNYLNYAAIDGAMTHNTLFTLYALLLYVTMKFYERPTVVLSMLIGSLVGLAALTRPTEIIAAIIPIFWGVNILKIENLKDRISFFANHKTKLVLAVFACALVGSIQLIYWKYASGEWIVYSYREQGFSWLRPHLRDGLVSYKSGWLTYSPFMVFSLLGFYALFRRRKGLFYATVLFSSLFIYIAFAWDVWWYGGSLGQRAMVQSYPILALPLCAFFSWFVNTKKWVQILLGIVIGVFFYANLWFTHQSHLGGIIHVGEMRKAYYWKTLFTYRRNLEDLKLLDDVNVLFEGSIAEEEVIYTDSSFLVVLDQINQRSHETIIPFFSKQSDFDWIRASATFTIEQKEWYFWTMTQFQVEVRNDTQLVSNHMIRVQRLMNDGETKQLYIDIPKPAEPFTELVINFWNGEGDKKIWIRDLKVQVFNETN